MGGKITLALEAGTVVGGSYISVSMIKTLLTWLPELTGLMVADRNNQMPCPKYVSLRPKINTRKWIKMRESS